MSRQTLVMMAGPPGSGKTTLALALSKVLGWPTVDKDTLKSPMLNSGVPEEVAGPASYDLMFQVGRDLLIRQGLSVILDSPAGYPDVIERAAELAKDARARLRFVLCLADCDVRNQRLAARVSTESQWTRDTEILDDGGGRWLPLLPASTLEVRGESEAEALLRSVLEYLGQTLDEEHRESDSTRHRQSENVRSEFHVVAGSSTKGYQRARDAQ